MRKMSGTTGELTTDRVVQFQSFPRKAFYVTMAAAAASLAIATAEPAPSALPGEPSAEEILNGAYKFPASPAVDVSYSREGLATERLTKVPAPGVHPRLLVSPDDLPALRKRIEGTETGRAMLATLRGRVNATILCEGKWEKECFDFLAKGDLQGASKVLDQKKAPSATPGHYQPALLYPIVMHALDTMIFADEKEGKRVGAAIATYARLVKPRVLEHLKQPLSDDVWRVRISGPATGDWTSDQGLRDLLGGHLLGYAYDFSYNYMSQPDRDAVRSVIADATRGRVWMGALLPHHFRNWNWIGVGLSQPLLALSIEGEEGYDPRVYRLGVEIARDYLSYGISSDGCSTEAVGYTNFGLVWANPFLVAASRRGEKFLEHSHHRKMIDWYLASLLPFGGKWESHGDGGQTGPGIWTMMMWKYFYPQDPRVDFLYRNLLQTEDRKLLQGRYHIIEPLLWVSDPAAGKADPSKFPLIWQDPHRGSLVARNGWEKDSAQMQFECRQDSVGSSHEHADRGAFTFSALGRQWAMDGFRSVEPRYHNTILIDGKGQGFWPGPGRWLGVVDGGWAVAAACDAKPAYDWFWPKQITTEDPQSFIRFQFSRWADFKKQATAFYEAHPDRKWERDDRPSVVEHWKGFEAGDPRMWDEDAWPVRLQHNPVRKAFRSVLFVRNPKPYAIVVDDIEKDDHAHLYEWIMMTGLNTAVCALSGSDVTLCNASEPRKPDGSLNPGRESAQLLVRTLYSALPEPLDPQFAPPTPRLETFEKIDSPAIGGRSFGLDSRLVIPSRSKAPGFCVLLYPHRKGEPAPETKWSEDRKTLEVTIGGKTDTITFKDSSDGRRRIHMARAGESDIQLN